MVNHIDGNLSSQMGLPFQLFQKQEHELKEKG